MAGTEGWPPAEAAASQDNRQAAAQPDAHAEDRDARENATSAFRSYHRWLRLKRLALAAFLTTAALFFLWAVPWLPRGLDTQDYTSEFAFTVYLLACVTISATLSMAAQELARRKRERLEAWTSVYDEATGLRNRDYLYDRLSLERAHAELSNGTFSLLVLRLPGGDRGHAIKDVAELVERNTHRSDIVALLTGSELAILAPGVDEAQRDALLTRLLDVIHAELGGRSGSADVSQIQGGGATYPADGDDPHTLVQSARASARRSTAEVDAA